MTLRPSLSLFSQGVVTTATLVASRGVVAAGLNSSAAVRVAGPVRARSFEATADARLQRNVTSLADDGGGGGRVRRLLSVQGVSFQWDRDRLAARGRDSDGDGERDETVFGFVAQDVARAFPELVRPDADGYLGVQAGAFEPLLVEGLRLHDARLARLEDENRALRRELDDARRARDDDDELGARLARLEAKLEDNARCGCGPSVARES